MDKKYGVYICTGCGIGEALDIEKLCADCRRRKGSGQNPSLFCSKEGVDILKKEIADRRQYPGDRRLLPPGQLRCFPFRRAASSIGSISGSRWSGPIPRQISGADRRAEGRRGILRPRPDDGRRLPENGNGPGRKNQPARALQAGSRSPGRFWSSAAASPACLRRWMRPRPDMR